MTPLERACRALADLHGRDPDEPVLFAGDRRLWQEFIPQVRAVIGAIREPGDASLDAAAKIDVSGIPPQAGGREYWRVMIDALLKEDGE